MKQRCRDERGFTLVEVMVALSILVVGLLSVVGLMSSSIVMNRQSGEGARATNFALRRLEEIRNTPFDLITPRGQGMASQDAAADAELASLGLPSTNPTASPPAGATWDRQVTAIGTYSGQDSLKSVAVVVRWGAGGQQQEARMTTFVARSGMNKLVKRAATP